MTVDESRAEARRLVAGLGSNERCTLKCIVGGYSLEKIASKLGVSLDEAARLKAQLMKQLGATATADLVRVGINAQVYSDP